MLPVLLITTLLLILRLFGETKMLIIPYHRRIRPQMVFLSMVEATVITQTASELPEIIILRLVKTQVVMAKVLHPQLGVVGQILLLRLIMLTLGQRTMSAVLSETAFLMMMWIFLMKMSVMKAKLMKDPHLMKSLM